MKYYLVKLLTNTDGEDGSTIAKYDTLESALVGYHNTLAAFHNADDVLFAVVQILDELGTVTNLEIVDHRPAPVPPEPESEA